MIGQIDLPGKDQLTKLDLQQKRLKYRQALEKSLDEILKHLSQMPEVEKVILFGSYAAGRRDLLTDLDLIVVMETDQDILQRTARLIQKLHATVDLDLLVYTPEEFERQRESGFLRHSIETGKIIYEKKTI
jgi:predicted nucleotidyltransferase